MIHLVGQPNYWFDLWDRRHELATRLERSAPGAKIIDTGDGLMAYALGAPAASITGFVASADEAEAAHEGRTAYLRHLVDKGYDVVICGPHFYINSCDELAARAGMRGERLLPDKRTQTSFMRLHAPLE